MWSPHAPTNRLKSLHLQHSSCDTHDNPPIKHQRILIDSTTTTTTTNISSFPSDILNLIFAFFNAFRLIFVVSLVCRRWRRVALSSITHWDRLQFASNLQGALSLLPSLTEIQLDYQTPDLSGHTKLRSLSLDPNHDSPLVTGLTSLSFNFPSFHTHLLELNRTTLKRLALGTESDLHFPQLVSLEIWGYENFRRLMTRHASQLQHLGISAHGGLDLSSISFPNLRSLTAWGNRIVLQQALTLAPPGCQINLHANDSAACDPSIAPHITACENWSTDPASSLASLLECCPRLQAYMGGWRSSDDLASLQPHASRLTDLTLSKVNHQCLDVLLPLVTNLRKLNLNTDDPNLEFPDLTNVVYPHLAELTICHISITQKALKSLLKSTPSLRSLTIIAVDRDPKEIDEILSLLKQHHNLEIVVLRQLQRLTDLITSHRMEMKKRGVHLRR